MCWHKSLGIDLLLSNDIFFFVHYVYGYELQYSKVFKKGDENGNKIFIFTVFHEGRLLNRKK